MIKDEFKKKYSLDSLDKELASLITSKAEQAFNEMMEEEGKNNAIMVIKL